jgi:hypothetical protein
MGLYRLRRHVVVMAGKTVVALHEGRVDPENPSRFEDPFNLSNGCPRVMKVLKNRTRLNKINRSRAKRERLRLTNNINIRTRQDVHRDHTRVG